MTFELTMLLTPRAKTGQPDLIQMLELPFSLLDGLHLVQLGLKPELKSGGDKLKVAKVNVIPIPFTMSAD